MRKFKTPVSMFVTKQEIIKGNVIVRLRDLGYNTSEIGYNNELFTGMSNYVNDTQFLIYTDIKENYVNYSTGNKIDKNHINFTDVDLFVALAAMSEGEEFYPGEKVISKSRGSFLTVSNVENQDDRFLKYSILSFCEWKATANSDIFRKATREEIVNQFKYKPIEDKLTPKNGEIVEFSWNGIEWAKGEYIGEVKDVGYAVLRKGSYSSAEAALVVIQFIRKYSEPTKVTRAEIANLLGIDDFEIID